MNTSNDFVSVKPLTVNLNRKPNPLIAEQKYEITCTSAGSRPAAVITWYKGKKQLMHRIKVILNTTTEIVPLQLCCLQDETGNNFTMSQMFFTPTTDDDGKHVTCRAENPNVTGAYMEDTWRIEVVCK
jgi:hypothetical protein